MNSGAGSWHRRYNKKMPGSAAPHQKGAYGPWPDDLQYRNLLNCYCNSTVCSGGASGDAAVSESLEWQLCSASVRISTTSMLCGKLWAAGLCMLVASIG